LRVGVATCLVWCDQILKMMRISVPVDHYQPAMPW